MKTRTTLIKCIAMISLLCIGSLTACYAQEDTVVIKKRDFEDAIVLLAQGQNAKRYADTLQKWYHEDMDSANAHIRLLQKADSVARVYEQKLLEQITAIQLNRDFYFDKYTTEHNKRSRAFGIGPEIGYNPFTKKMYGGIGVHLSIVRFALFKASNTTQFGGGDGGGAGATGSFSDALRKY